MDPITEALEDYFNCHHCYTSATLRKEVTNRLFNVLTPATVNTVYRIRTTIGERDCSPLEITTQTENMILSKRLLVELGADLLFSKHPLRNLLTTYAMITYRRLLRIDRGQLTCHDEIVDILAYGLAHVKDTSRMLDTFDYAIRRSGIITVERTELFRMLRTAIQKEMREAAWCRRRHLVAVYDEESICSDA